MISGIESKASDLYHTVEKIFTKVRAYLPFSPAKEGPLRDLHRIRFTETIAQAMRPAPMVAAVARVASVAALAGPMMMAGAGAGGGVVINVNQTISIGAGADVRGFRAELRRHAKDIGEIVTQAMEQRRRTEF